MNILVLISDAFGGIGGIARFNTDLLSALARHPKVRTLTCLPRSISRPYEPLPGVLDYRSRAAEGLAAYLAESVKCMSARVNYDLIICGHVNLLPLAEIFRRRFRCPMYAILYGIEAWSPPSLLRRFCMRYVDKFLTISDFTWERFTEWSRSNTACFRLTPGTDLELFKPGPKTPRLLQEYELAGAHVVITVGRMDAAEKWKGFDQMLEVLPRLNRGAKKWKYIIVGGGNDMQRLQTKAQSLGLSRDVIFTGYVDDEQKADHYRLADVYAMPSQAEGFGIVFLEALASGLAVVGSTDDAGSEVLKNGKWGYLANPFDLEAIQASLERAITDPIHVCREDLEEYSMNRFEQRCHMLLNDLGAVSAHEEN